MKYKNRLNTERQPQEIFLCAKYPLLSQNEKKVRYEKTDDPSTVFLVAPGQKRSRLVRSSRDEKAHFCKVAAISDVLIGMRPINNNF